jgi:hypothetical protein
MEESAMHVTVSVRAVATMIASTLAVFLLAGPTQAQGRGMMMPMPAGMQMMSMPAGMPMMPMPAGTAMMQSRMSMSNPRAALLLAALRQREAFLISAQRQVELQMVALEMRPASSTRTALLLASQRQQIALTQAMRQTALQIAALGG